MVIPTQMYSLHSHRLSHWINAPLSSILSAPGFSSTYSSIMPYVLHKSVNLPSLKFCLPKVSDNVRQLHHVPTVTLYGSHRAVLSHYVILSLFTIHIWLVTWLCQGYFQTQLKNLVRMVYNITMVGHMTMWRWFSNSAQKIQSGWYITSLCSIYGRSHDYAKVIFKLSSKIRSEWYITSLCSIMIGSDD